MKRLIAGMSLLLASMAGAQAPNQAAPEDLFRWSHRVLLTLPNAPEGAFVQVPLAPALYGQAKPDLSDVRLATDDGRVLPFAVVEWTGQTEQAVRDGKIFDRRILPDRSEQLSMDLGERPGEHNEIALEVQTRSYGRAVRLEASDDGSRFAELAKGELVYLTIGGQSIDQRRLGYLTSRSRYLRLTLGPDRVDTTEPPVLRNFEVRYRLERPAQMQRAAVASVSKREPVRQGGEAASAWTIVLPDRVPVSALYVQVAAQQIERRWQVEVLLDGPSYWEPRQRLIASGVLRRAADAPEEAIALTFPETQARRLRLTITDARNAPLTLGEVEYGSIKRTLVFQRPAAVQTIYAYLGNPEAPPPRYEITLPADVSKLPEGVAGARQENPLYQPPPPPVLPWSERNQWLIDAVTLVGVALLAGLLLSLALANLRQAAARRAAAQRVEQNNPD